MSSMPTIFNDLSLWLTEASQQQQLQLLTFCTAVGFAVFSTARYFRSPWRKLPPGPRGLPLLGNALQMGGPQWLTFIKWSEQFGDVFYLNAMGKHMVVLNTQKAASDLLDRRAEIYSDRPRNIVAGEILCDKLAIPLLTYGPLWHKMHNAIHEALDMSFEVPQLNEAILLTSGLLAQPAIWDKHIRRTTASFAMTMTYGTPSMISEQDPGVKAIDGFMAHMTRATRPGAFLVELFPWMLRIPSRFAKWKRDAENWHKNDSQMFVDRFNGVREKLSKGTDSLSLVGTWIKGTDRYGLSEREGAWLAGMAYAGGADTTAASMEWWMLAMIAYPDVQRRAQAELDAVVGRTRIPTFSDFQRLPYIRAMVKETLRWRPMARLGFPHLTTEDDWYDGMFIPKGTMVFANVWHLNRDHTTYGADAEHFNPARFLDVNGDVAPCSPDTKGEGHNTFGFGKRLCPGRHVANNAFFIDIAMALWACNIGPGKDEHGNVIPIDVDAWVDGLHIRPPSFKVDISPRFPEAVTLLAGERKSRIR
ncbi:cytochrome P450 [Lactarius indigo]|nr:cytochrome P450 [Lactarius indigo]